MTNEEIEDLGLKYNPGLSFGEIPHLFWKPPIPRVIRQDMSVFAPNLGKSGAFFCRAFDSNELFKIFHLKINKNSIVCPMSFSLKAPYGPRINLHPLHWDLWLYDASWGRLVSCRTIFSSFEEEERWLAGANKESFCRQYHMAETFFPLFQTFYKTWSPKSSLAYMARLASA